MTRYIRNIHASSCLTYACGPAQQKKKDEKKRLGFESKILWNIIEYNIVQTITNNMVPERFEKRKNDDLQKLYIKPSFRNFLASKRDQNGDDACGERKEV